MATAVGGFSAAARAQDLLLSKGVKGENLGPALAVDPNTGNVLVVWYGEQHVWASLLRRKGNGKYKRPRPRKLSSDEEFQLDPRVAWIEANNEFLVIWEYDGGFPGPIFKRILGVPVNVKTGRRVGKVKTLVADDDNHASPVFVTGLTNKSGGPRKAGSSVGRIVWRKEPRSNDDPTMEWASLSDTYEISDRATLPDSQMGFGPIIGALALSGGGARTPASLEGGALPHCVVTVHQKGSPPKMRLVMILWRDGKNKKEIEVPTKWLWELRPAFSRNSAEAAFTLGVRGGSEAGSILYRVKIPPCDELKGSEIRHDYTDPTGAFLGPQNILVLEPRQGQDRQDAPAGHLVSAEDDERAYRRAVDLQGNLLDGPETLFSHDNKLTSLIARDVSSAKSSGKKPNAIIVWTKSVGKGFDQEIWAHSFYVEPFE